MTFDVGSLTKTMINGVRNAIGDRWAAIRAFAEPELRKIALTLEDVRQLHADGVITADHAFQLVEMQRNTALTVVSSVKGLGVLTARQAIDAAAHAAGAVVNRLVGFQLIGSNPISQEPAKNSSTGRTSEKGNTRPDSPAKPAPRPVKAKFKAGKDL
jgi:hypothetical protein